jgi:hypothetical protein
VKGIVVGALIGAAALGLVGLVLQLGCPPP